MKICTLALVVCSIGACSTTTAPPGGDPAAGAANGWSQAPTLDDFAAGDRGAVAAILRDAAARLSSPYTPLPGSRAITILIHCSVQWVRGVGVGVECLSAAPSLDLAIGDRVQLYYAPDWTQQEFGVRAPALAIGEVRPCVVYGTGFGGNLWKRFLIFPGPAHTP